MPLQTQLEQVRDLHNRDLAEGFGTVYLPHALARKYPQANREWGWQYVFPSTTRSGDPRSGEIRRHHWHDQNVQRALRKAARRGCDQADQYPCTAAQLRDTPA